MSDDKGSWCVWKGQHREKLANVIQLVELALAKSGEAVLKGVIEFCCVERGTLAPRLPAPPPVVERVPVPVSLSSASCSAPRSWGGVCVPRSAALSTVALVGPRLPCDDKGRGVCVVEGTQAQVHKTSSMCHVAAMQRRGAIACIDVPLKGDEELQVAVAGAGYCRCV